MSSRLVPVRVLIAPDSFGGTLTSLQAAQAIASGWSRHAPHDEIDLAPLSDGGPGFVNVLAASLGGQLIPVVVTGAMGQPATAEILVVGDTAYIESAHSCATSPSHRDVTTASTFGLGQCILAARQAGARRIVIGVGGTGTNDAGAGVVAALGAEPGSILRRGGLALRELRTVDLEPAHRAIAGVEIVVATDVDVPLLGLRGATNGFAPQKGATPEQVMALEGALAHFASLLGRRSDGKDPAVALGAGSGGGLAYALMHLGAQRVPGLSTVQEVVALKERISRSDIVITGEGTFDWSSLRGKVVSGVAGMAQDHGIPVIVLAGQVMVGRREFGAIGVESAYSMADLAGSVSAAMDEPQTWLAAAAQRVASTWSR